MASKTEKVEQSADFFAEVAAEERRLLQTLDQLRQVKGQLVTAIGASAMPEQRSSGIKTVRVVTRKHGDIFAREWFYGDDIREALDATEVMTWPDEKEAQGQYHDIEDEILKRIPRLTKRVISAAFVRAANEVRARERLRGRAQTRRRNVQK